MALRLLLNSLDNDTISNIFLGKVHHWQNIKNSKLDANIDIIIKQEGRSTREIFDQFFNTHATVLDSTEIGSNAEALVLVGIKHNAIGYASIGAIERAIQLGLRIRPLLLNGVDATSKNVENHTFPLPSHF